MIVIKPVLEEKQDAQIAVNAARAPYFAVFEDESLVKFIKNPFVSGGGAGFAVAELLHQEGCNKFVAKKIGENMKSKLDEYGIVYEII